MDIEVLNCLIKPCSHRVGFLEIRYGVMHMKCDLAYLPKARHVWVRMPEIWTSPNHKHCFCRWPSKQISDLFQGEVLRQIYEKYDLSHQKVVEIHVAACEARGKKTDG